MLLLYGSELGFTADPVYCPHRQQRIDNLMVSFFYLAQIRSCGVSATDDSMAVKWRSHIVLSNGEYMVFNNYGYGPVATDTGARVFWFFPRLQIPKVQMSESIGGSSGSTQPSLSSVIHLVSASRVSFKMDTKTSRIVGSDDMEIFESEEISRENNGGVEIMSYPGILLDSGFRMGEAPYVDPDRLSCFRDRVNRSCCLANRELFTYRYIPRPNRPPLLEEVYFNFDTMPSDGNDSIGDLRLAEFLAAKCPLLDASFPKALKKAGF